VAREWRKELKGLGEEDHLNINVKKRRNQFVTRALPSLEVLKT